MTTPSWLVYGGIGLLYLGFNWALVWPLIQCIREEERRIREEKKRRGDRDGD